MGEIPFPVRLGTSIDSAADVLGESVLDSSQCDPALLLADAEPPETDWRTRKFTVMRPINRGRFRYGSVDSLLGYRAASRVVWSIKILSPSRGFASSVEGVPLQNGIAAVLRALGDPLCKAPSRYGSLIDEYWFRQSEIGFEVRVLREDHDDGIHSWSSGELKEFRAVLPEHAPPWQAGPIYLPRSAV